MAFDLNDHSENELISDVADRLHGRNTSGGKYLHKAGVYGNVIRMKLGGGKKIEDKTIYVIPLGLPNSLRLRRFGINRFMVEDYYVEAAFQVGELKEDKIQGYFVTSKELLEKELLTESVLEKGEEDYLTNLLERCDLNKVASNIIEKIRPSLEV